MASSSIWTAHLHHSPPHPHGISTNTLQLRTALSFEFSYRVRKRKQKQKQRCVGFVLRACSDSNSAISDDGSNRVKDEVVVVEKENAVVRLRETIGSYPPMVFLARRLSASNFAAGLCFATVFFVVAIRVYVTRKSKHERPGSVADLVRRGQLKSDRRGISKPLMYDDPFDNPLVKISKSNSTVEMCGKTYRLAPVTLTREQKSIHQERRSRAYQWKRPTIFLKEGDAIPPDVDPDTVRWIPANHPFATTTSDIDENLAQSNVYQKHGVPYRIQAEHKALQKKLESLQSDQKLKNVVIDSGTLRNYERPSKSQVKSDDENAENKSSNGQVGSKPQRSDHEVDSFGRGTKSEEKQTP